VGPSWQAFTALRCRIGAAAATPDTTRSSPSRIGPAATRRSWRDGSERTDGVSAFKGRDLLGPLSIGLRGPLGNNPSHEVRGNQLRRAFNEIILQRLSHITRSSGGRQTNDPFRILQRWCARSTSGLGQLRRFGERSRKPDHELFPQVRGLGGASRRLHGVELSIALFDTASPFVPGNRGADMVRASALA